MNLTDNTPKVLVAIKCLTYNHEPYIRDALEGFVMQKTNFRFVAIVHEDASTDGTANIVREYAEKYPDIIKPIFETENQYSKKNSSLTKIMAKALEATGAKYIAMCEGDDYWTDPHKLQKQVDFLEENSEYGMCYTRIHNLDDCKGVLGDAWGGPLQTFSDLLEKSNTIPTLTVLFKQSLVTKYYEAIKPQDKNWPMGDYPMWLYFAYESKIKFINEVTGVYRILPESASHTNNNLKWLKFCKAYRDIRLFFANRYNCLAEFEDTIRYSYFRLLLRRFTLNNFELKDECLKALSETNLFSDCKKKLFQFAIQFKPANLLLQSIYIIKDVLLHWYSLSRKNSK